jgi:hypothetical protein
MSSVIRRSLSFAVVGTCLLLMSPLAETLQARRSSMPAAAPSHVDLYVDASSGSDSNPGSRSQPLKTINRAAQLAIGNQGRDIPTTITINSGTYREYIGIGSNNPNTEAPIVFQASKNGTVIVSGSEVWTSWQPDSLDPRRFVHSWTYQWGVCGSPPRWPVLPEVIARREMVIVNGHILTPVLSQDRMTEGSFFVDEAAGRAIIWPPAGTDMSTATIEVPLRPRLFESHHVSSLTIRGIVFEHSNACVSMNPSAAVAIIGGANVSIEDCTFGWNNWTGLRVDGLTDSSIRRITASYNGALGILGFRLKQFSAEDVETSYNNWRGALGEFYEFEPAGGKFLHVHGGVFKNFRSVGNQASGLWFDTNNSDVTVDQAFLANNRLRGFFIEANMGPITLKNSRICGNAGDGFEGQHSESVSLIGNLFYNNHKSQIFVDSISDQRSVYDPDTKSSTVAVSQGWLLHGNTIVGTDAGEILYKTYQNSSDNSQLFLRTMNSDDNTWYNAASSNVFQIDRGGRGHRPENVDFLRWQSVTGRDKNSTFQPPATDPAASCEVR